MNQENVSQKNWQKNWAGPWSLLSCAYLGYQYTSQLKEAIGVSLEETLFIVRKGISSCYFLDDHKEVFGRSLAQKVDTNLEIVHEWADELKKVTDDVLSVVQRLKSEPVTLENFTTFVESMYRYGVKHRIVKVVVDYLSEEVLQRYLAELSEARVYAEPAYEQTESYMRYIAEQVAKENPEYSPDLILALKKDQWEVYLETEVLPQKEVLEAQYASTILYMNDGELDYIDSVEEQKSIEKVIFGAENRNEIKGQTAYKGRITGVVHIVLDPLEVTNFQEGDILVTGMTRPEYLSLVRKSAAFITDAGGILSHAAITARELKKPCVIGTNVATRVLKDGDMVEVDADKGVVTILERVEEGI